MALDRMLKMHDFWASTAVAGANLDGRVPQLADTTDDLPTAWTHMAPGHATFGDLARVAFTDNVAGASPKRVIRAAGAVGVWGGYHLPRVAMLNDAMQIRGRISLIPPAGATGGFGIGFARSEITQNFAQGVWAGWRWLNATDIRLEAYMVSRLFGVWTLNVFNGADILGVAVAPFSRYITFGYNRNTGTFAFAIPDFGVTWNFLFSDFGFPFGSFFGIDSPSLMFEAQTAAAGTADAIMELIGFARGTLTGTTLTLLWIPVNQRDYIYEAELDFATAPRYTVPLSTTLDGSKRIKARHMVFASYDNAGDVEIFINNTRVIVPAGRELRLDAPDANVVDVQGAAPDLITIRLYTGEYQPYQRD